MKWLLMAGIILMVLAALAVIVGLRLPRDHRASKQQMLAAAPDVVWSVITEVDAYPTWRSDVKTVRRLPDRNGCPVWIEAGRSGTITFAAERMEAPRLLVTRIADPGLPFGGTWTYEIEPAAAGSRVTITENGEIYHPMFRVMARFVFGYDGTIGTYMASLETKLRSMPPRAARAAGIP
ncbi:MAG: SRPBCC family protein [Acidobacteriota bacterium]